jgi:hypothetical protein
LYPTLQARQFGNSAQQGQLVVGSAPQNHTNGDLLMRINCRRVTHVWWSAQTALGLKSVELLRTWVGWNEDFVSAQKFKAAAIMASSDNWYRTSVCC